MKKRIAVGTAVTIAVLFGTVTPMAAQAAASSMFQTTISLNGETISNPEAFTFDGTTYMPVYYVQQMLDDLGINNTWDGSGPTQRWSFQTTQSVHLNLSGKSGTVTITVNGNVVESKVPHFVTVDPSSGQTTTFVPIWYIEQLLTALGIKNQWDGTPSVRTWVALQETAFSNSHLNGPSGNASPPSGTIANNGIPTSGVPTLFNPDSLSISYQHGIYQVLWPSSYENGLSTNTPTTINDEEYHFFNHITVHVDDENEILSMPGFGQNSLLGLTVVNITDNNKNLWYSYDGGANWQSVAAGYDSSTPSFGGTSNPPANVEFKAPIGSTINITLFMNNSAAQGTLGDLFVQYEHKLMVGYSGS